MRELSKRLMCAAGLVPNGSRVADIGTDHGFLPIYLVQEKIASSALAMDLREGPLSRAREHVKEAELEDKITLRISNGLEKLEPGEADTVVICGMGGPLIVDILTAGKELLPTLKALVLSPQSDWRETRRAIRGLGLRIEEEKMVYEEGKFYLILLAKPGENEVSLEEDAQELLDRFGAFLPARKDPVLSEYLAFRTRVCNEIRIQLEKAEPESVAIRLSEVAEELKYLEMMKQIIEND